MVRKILRLYYFMFTSEISIMIRKLIQLAVLKFVTARIKKSSIRFRSNNNRKLIYQSKHKSYPFFDQQKSWYHLYLDLITFNTSHLDTIIQRIPCICDTYHLVRKMNDLRINTIWYTVYTYFIIKMMKRTAQCVHL